ncbi:MAG TPA: hypothetical protein DCW68_02570 [Rhodospirillaceae bacterium]|nr:MAG: hypothetical protein A2018_05545 [Alphaproteobacteria bacterium GWF2_58_20]HAU28978.1 hypothetical protein [Rhodospirillaceae bacterium]
MTDSLTARLRRTVKDGAGTSVAPTRGVNAGDPTHAATTSSGEVLLPRLADMGAMARGPAMRDAANNWNWQRQLRQNLGPYIEPLAKLAGVSGTVSIDLRFANVFELSLAGDTTLVLAGFPVPAGVDCSAGVTLIVNNPGGYVLSWPASVVPMDEVEDTVAAGKRAVFVLLTTDNGASWDLMSAGARDV